MSPFFESIIMAEEVKKIPHIYLSERLNIFEPIDVEYFSNGGLPPDSGIELIEWINKGIEQGVILVGEAWETNLSYDVTTGVISNDNGTGFTIPLATLYRKGLISQSDYAKLNHITVTKNIDLDKLLETQLPIIFEDSGSIKKEETIDGGTDRYIKFKLSNIETATLGQVPVKGYNDEILWVSLNVEPLIQQVDKTPTSFRLKVSENSSVEIDSANSEFAGLLPSEDKILIDSSTSINTPESLVKRDINGSFEAEGVTLNIGTINTNAIDPKDITNLETVEAKIQDAVSQFKSDKNKVIYESVPSTTWIHNHGLEKYPSVTTMDTTGRVVFGGVDHIDTNTTILTWSVPFSGSAIYN